MAERMAILHGLNAPEFFDKILFRRFINLLRKEGVIDADDDGQLTYKQNLEYINKDAPLVLNAEFRQSILQVATDVEEVTTEDVEETTTEGVKEITTEPIATTKT